MAGEDFYLEVGSNLSSVMKQLDDAITKANLFSATVNRASDSINRATQRQEATTGLVDRRGNPYRQQNFSSPAANLAIEKSLSDGLMRAILKVDMSVKEITRTLNRGLYIRSFTPTEGASHGAFLPVDGGNPKQRNRVGTFVPGLSQSEMSVGMRQKSALSYQAHIQRMELAQLTGDIKKEILSTQSKLRASNRVSQARSSVDFSLRDRDKLISTFGPRVTGSQLGQFRVGKGTMLDSSIVRPDTGVTMAARLSGFDHTTNPTSLLFGMQSATKFDKESIQATKERAAVTKQLFDAEQKVAKASQDKISRMVTEARKTHDRPVNAFNIATRRELTDTQMGMEATRLRGLQPQAFNIATRGPLSQAQLNKANFDQIEKSRKAMAAFNKEEAHGPGLGTTLRRGVLWTVASTAIFGAVGAGAAFISTMVKMDKQIADLRKKISGTAEDFEKLTNAAIGIATRYKASTQDVLDAIELFSGKFKSTADLTKLAESAVLFSNISGQTLGKSAETLTSTIEQYNLSVSQASEITDGWAAVAGQTAVSVSDLGDAVGVVGVAAKTAGIDLNELNAIVGAVAAGTGQSGTQIGNALKRIFERSTAPRNLKTLQENEINPLDAAGNIRPFLDILSDVDEKWGKITDTEKKNIAVAFAGARQYNSFLAIMDNYNEVLRLTEVSANSFGEAQRQNDRIADTFVKKMQALGVQLDSFARNVGQYVIPALGGLTDMLTGLLGLINNLGGQGSSGLAKLSKDILMLAGAFGAAELAGRGIGKLFGISNIVSSSGKAGGFSVGKAVGGLAKPIAGGITGLGELIGATVTGGGAGTAMTGLAGTLTPFLVGLGAIVTALIGMGMAVELTTNKFEEFTEIEEERKRKVKQDIEISKNLSTKLKDLTKDFDKAKTGREKRAVNSSIGGFLSDIRSNQDLIGIGNADDMFSRLGIEFDALGNVTNMTTEKMRGLTAEIENAAERLANLSTVAHTAALRESFAEVKAFFQDQGVIDKNNNVLGLNGSKVNLDEFLGALETAASSRGIRKGGKLSDEQIRSFRNDPQFSSVVGNKITGETIGDLWEGLGKLEYLRVENQKAWEPTLRKVKAEVTAKSGPEAGKKAELELIEILNKSQLSGVDLLGREFYGIPINRELMDLKGLNPLVGLRPTSDIETDKTTGVPQPTDGGRRRRTGIDRIDFDLQRSLHSNQASFDLLGSETPFVANVVGAYKKAIVDLATDTNRAAGPKEEAAILSEQKTVNGMKDLLAQKDEVGKNQKKMAEEVLDLSEKERQSIQVKNSERKKGIEILREELVFLETIATFQESIRGQLSSGLSSILPNYDENRGSIKQLEADRKFLNARIGREREVQARDGIANTPEGRNRLKALREEMEALDRSVTSVNEKTDVLSNTLRGIGDSFIGTASKKFSDFAVEGLGSLASGSLSGTSLFGENNPLSDVLAGPDGRREKLLKQIADNTKKMADVALGEEVGDAVGEVIGGSAKTKNADEKKLISTVSAGVLGALAGAGTGLAITQGLNKQGAGGAIGGAIGGAAGAVGSKLIPGIGGTLVGIAGPIIGGLLGSLFDDEKKPIEKSLDELEDTNKKMTIELMKLEKSLNTVNDTMENLINAPSDFSVPIPKGILENSIAAQSAIAVPLQAGGVIVKSGPIFAHAGERYSGVGGSMGGSSVVNNMNININGATSDPREIADEVTKQVQRELFDQSSRGARFQSRF